MAGYASKRTGQATEALLDKVENQCLFTGNALNFVSGSLIYATGSGLETQASQRVTESNSIIASTDLSHGGIVICNNTGGKSNAVSTNTGVIAGLAEIIVASNGVANIVSNFCNLASTLTTDGGTIVNAASIFSTLKSNRGSLVGVYLQFTFNSKLTHANVSSEHNNYIGASFSDGTNVYYLNINTTSGVYDIKTLFDASANHFLVE